MRLRIPHGGGERAAWRGLLSFRLRSLPVAPALPAPLTRRRCIPRDKSGWERTPCPGLSRHPASLHLPRTAGEGSGGSRAASGPVWRLLRPRHLGCSQPSSCARGPKAWASAAACGVPAAPWSHDSVPGPSGRGGAVPRLLPGRALDPLSSNRPNGSEECGLALEQSVIARHGLQPHVCTIQIFSSEAHAPTIQRTSEQRAFETPQLDGVTLG